MRPRVRCQIVIMGAAALCLTGCSTELSGSGRFMAPAAVGSEDAGAEPGTAVGSGGAPGASLPPSGADPETARDAGTTSHGPGAEEADAGTVAFDAGALPPASPDPVFGGPIKCSSGQTWTGGNEDSPLMRPGHACIECHTQSDEGPGLSLAGTVFATGHEPDDCNGAGLSGVEIEIVDVAGKVLRVVPNQAGNFFSSSGGLEPPFETRVLYQGRERRMVGLATSGDCNSCHTRDGVNGAPGRVALP